MKMFIAPLAVAAVGFGMLAASSNANSAAPTPSICVKQVVPSFSGPVNQPNNSYSCSGVEMQSMLGFQCVDARCSSFRLTFYMRARRQTVPGWIVSSAEAKAIRPRATCNLAPLTTAWTPWCDMAGATDVVLVAVTLPR